ncbi:hypothetical protein CPB83DRAFT_624864 [Crepidotus variabilis]|uniref:Uncharacterized protein n=1 Tax=Crepidotus variabilis TaxID=179855 RepID=A0A9P6EMM5_9AGAR|nr:hypothetical protein CPB83DRAFT_624864 [Crepidotus variabilis]
MENAVAGPSSLNRQSLNSTPSNSAPAAGASLSSPNSKGHPPLTYPVVYLPPPGMLSRSLRFFLVVCVLFPRKSIPPPKQHLASTQDLLGRLQLHPAYDKYVRPYIHPQPSTIPGHVLLPDGTTSSNPINGVDGNTPGAGPATPGGVGAVDKGKGREVPIPGGDVDMHDAGDGDDDGDGTGKGEKKKKNSYKHLIKGIPGKHSIKKDDYLVTMMLVPPKQRMRIRRFDEKTQEDAFTVSLDGLKGWNINTLVVESAQAREDRKKRVRYLHHLIHGAFSDKHADDDSLIITLSQSILLTERSEKSRKIWTATVWRQYSVNTSAHFFGAFSASPTTTSRCINIHGETRNQHTKTKRRNASTWVKGNEWQWTCSRRSVGSDIRTRRGCCGRTKASNICSQAWLRGSQTRFRGAQAC